MAGQEYTTAAGKAQRKKQVHQSVARSASGKCTAKIDKSMLEVIFKSFCDLKTYKRQKEYIYRHVAEKETRTNLGSDKQPASKTR